MATNLLSAESSSFEGGTTGSWISLTNAAVSNRSGLGYDGTHCLQYSPVATGEVQIESGRVGVLSSQMYSYVIWVLPSTIIRTVTMYAAYYDGSNTYISSSDQVATPERTSGQWSELLLWDVSPAAAQYVRIVVTIASAPASEVHYLDLAQMIQGQQQPSSGQGAGVVAAPLFQISTGGITLDMSPAQTWTTGIAIATKDLGGPAVREIIYDHSQMHGSTDDTKYFSQRVVNITGSCIPTSNGASRAVAWERLAPFLDPGLRSTLAYSFDLSTGPRKLTNLRLSSVSRTANSPVTYAFQIQWAADPIAQALTETIANIASSSGAAGRTYPRKYGLMYPSSHGTVGVWSDGLLDAWPIYTFYGACNNPTIAITDASGNTILGQIKLQMSIPGGRYVVVNARARTITWDDGTDTYSTIDLDTASWVPIRPGTNYLRYTYSTGAPGSHCSVEWNDSFLY